MNSLLKKILLSLFGIVLISFHCYSNDIPKGPELSENDVTVEMTNVIMKGIDAKIKVHFKNSYGKWSHMPMVSIFRLIAFTT